MSKQLSCGSAGDYQADEQAYIYDACVYAQLLLSLALRASVSSSS